MIKAIMESTTLKMVVGSLLVLNYQWLSGGIEGTLIEYATASSTLLAIWVGREWRAAHYKD